MAKSRLAPSKAVTIPRMELTAAVLAKRLDRMIKQELSLPVSISTFWTNSACVLRYIKPRLKISYFCCQSHRNCFRAVFTNVGKIRRNCFQSGWRSNQGGDSPGLLTRRTTDERTRIRRSQEEWPKRPADVGKIPRDDPEVKKSAECFANEASNQQDDYLIDVFKTISS